MQNCPCCSGQAFTACCEPYLATGTLAPTAEALMRSRYTAFTLADIKYLGKTAGGQAKQQFNKGRTRRWASAVTWISLTIVSTKAGLAQDKNGWVEYIACFQLNGKQDILHEISEFRKDADQWLYISGQHLT